MHPDHDDDRELHADGMPLHDDLAEQLRAALAPHDVVPHRPLTREDLEDYSGNVGRPCVIRGLDLDGPEDADGIPLGPRITETYAALPPLTITRDDYERLGAHDLPGIRAAGTDDDD